MKALLFRPDDQKMLTEGTCGTRPPIVYRLPNTHSWGPLHEYNVRQNPSAVRALVLVWDGVVSAEGCYMLSKLLHEMPQGSSWVARFSWSPSEAMTLVRDSVSRGLGAYVVIE